jgi:N-methylhydantoinase A
VAKIGADIGGTFTDVVLEAAEKRFSIKLLTTYDAPERALLEAVDILLGQAGLAPVDIGLLVHGTTLATNALIERRGVRTAMLTTAGFRDVLEMGTESRFDQYDIAMEKPTPLVPRRLRLGVPERVAADGEVLLPLDEAAVRAAAATFRAEQVASIAVAFLHSYANPAHEQAAARILEAELPGVSLSLSSEVSPEMREYERFSTTAANAYVRPLVADYLLRLDRKMTERGFRCPLFLMLSSGGLTSVETAARFPVRLVESGPAGGAIFAASIAAELGIAKMLALDVGGTTAKICLIDDAKPQRSQGFEVARMHRFRKGSGLPLRIPVIEMVEIGAGGGSIARLDLTGRLTVGPQSAGSEPGPACYGRGGLQPTVTDADLMLGRIDPGAFAGGTFSLDQAATERALNNLGQDTPAQTMALGISEIVDETMVSAARVHAIEQGTTIDERTLVAFGGAAPLHAARIAEKLGIDRVIVPRSAGVGSAVGFLRAPIAYEISRSLHQRISTIDYDRLDTMLSQMSAEAHEVVTRADGRAERTESRLAFARYCGQGYEIAVDLPTRRFGPGDGNFLISAFEAVYRAQYGRVISDLPIEILTWRVTVSTIVPAAKPQATHDTHRAVVPTQSRPVLDTATAELSSYGVVRRAELGPGDRIAGPALIIEDETTTVVSPVFDATVDARNYLVLTRKPLSGKRP